MQKIKNCKICGKEFVTDKYHPNQQVCSDLQCQHKRQILNQKAWRHKNPDYFRYQQKRTLWEKKRAHYLKMWRLNHKDYFRLYRKKRKGDQKINSFEKSKLFINKEKQKIVTLKNKN